ncbi:MAG: DEAD/DEAH box helicase [Deltaproteobacteria bacterium]|nr:DEAD/DEAH box helicase [Deltaproteobacteria bacterium]
MTTSPPSSSEAEAAPNASPSTSFSQLHPKIQRWIWTQRWTELRDVQEDAIPVILRGSNDVIIAAATATGKTEAAFLPICTRIASGKHGGLHALDVSPLKALINDQYDRLLRLCEHLEIPVHRWHGDVAAKKKHQLLDDPAGVLLITPESLEALFVLRGTTMPRLFGVLEYVVIDELHSFLGNERGRQLQSLLHRVEEAAGRRVPRVGLSATLGDMGLAADFLRPGEADAYGRSDISRSLLLKSAMLEKHSLINKIKGETVKVKGDIRNLSRQNVELYADLLRRLADKDRVPNEFWPHHGSLAKELREHVEDKLKDTMRPVTAVCTSTLELGIDIGSVKSVAQIGAPPSVASLRQRLGRSGRRKGEAAILRVYVQEEEITSATAPQDALRAELVQTVAMVNLLLSGWCEPSLHGQLHLSTLVQQLLSLIAQHGGVTALRAWQQLCEAGPFRDVDQPMFASLLRSLARRDLLEQAPDGALLLGLKGERMVNHYSFYAAFSTPDEYRLVSDGKPLGSLPITHPVIAGMYLIFAGRRWRVCSVDAGQRLIVLAPAHAGRVPRFGGGSGVVHDRVRQEMLAIYQETSLPAYVDACAQSLLGEGRGTFAQHMLSERRILEHGRATLLFCWMGDRVMDTVMLQLLAKGLAAERDGICVALQGVSGPELVRHLRDLAHDGPPDPFRLAAAVRNKVVEKHDWCLDEPLLCAEYAARSLDTDGAWRAVTATLAAGGG